MNASSTIVVAMSGGVDSSVAALLLRDQGYDCIGISMQVWDYRNNGGSCTRATCCAPDDFTDARKVASKVGIPYYVFDFEKIFRTEVIDTFVATYARGETPNPCIECNNKVKFKALRDRAEAFGCSHVATGHYARIRQDEEGFHLLRGNDLDKDQSYFLYGLKQSELARTIFPIGHLTKDVVREMARDAGLVTASKPESQDICFVSGTVQDFLVKIGGKKPNGTIVQKDGVVLGEHEGINNFTVGQRRGLKIGGFEEPIYVLEIDPAGNRIIVGSKSDLERDSFYVKDVSWISPRILNLLQEGSLDSLTVTAQLRHRHPGVRCEIKAVGEGQLHVTFLEGWSTVSPGQAAVFYDLDNVEVLGGGRIANQFSCETQTLSLGGLVELEQKIA